MINTCLTVRAREANSHAGKGWELLTQKVIDVVAKQRTQGVVFLAWGSPAQARVKGVDAQRHLILKSVHPSPLAAHKGFVSLSPCGTCDFEGKLLTCGFSSLTVDTLKRRMSGWCKSMGRMVGSIGTWMWIPKRLVCD